MNGARKGRRAGLRQAQPERGPGRKWKRGFDKLSPNGGFRVPFALSLLKGRPELVEAPQAASP
jgi:hypothetical protein